MKAISKRLQRLEQKRLYTDEPAIVLGVGKTEEEIADEVRRKEARLRPGSVILIMDM